MTRPGFILGIQALASSAEPTPHLLSIERWRTSVGRVPTTRTPTLPGRICVRSCAGSVTSSTTAAPRPPCSSLESGPQGRAVERTYDSYKSPTDTVYDWQHAETGAEVRKAQHPSSRCGARDPRPSGRGAPTVHAVQARGRDEVSDMGAQPAGQRQPRCQTCNPYEEGEILARRTIQDGPTRCSIAPPAPPPNADAIAAAKRGGASAEQLAPAWPAAPGAVAARLRGSGELDGVPRARGGGAHPGESIDSPPAQLAAGRRPRRRLSEPRPGTIALLAVIRALPFADEISRRDVGGRLWLIASAAATTRRRRRARRGGRGCRDRGRFSGGRRAQTRAESVPRMFVPTYVYPGPSGSGSSRRAAGGHRGANPADGPGSVLDPAYLDAMARARQAESRCWATWPPPTARTKRGDPSDINTYYDLYGPSGSSCPRDRCTPTARHGDDVPGLTPTRRGRAIRRLSWRWGPLLPSYIYSPISSFSFRPSGAYDAFQPADWMPSRSPIVRSPGDRGAASDGGAVRRARALGAGWISLRIRTAEPLGQLPSYFEQQLRVMRLEVRSRR